MPIDSDSAALALSALALLAPICAFARDGGSYDVLARDINRLGLLDADNELAGLLELALSRDMRIALARQVEGAIDACVEDAGICGILGDVIGLLDPRNERTGA